MEGVIMNSPAWIRRAPMQSSVEQTASRFFMRSDICSELPYTERVVYEVAGMY